jgi:UDP-N-acetylmuramate--alanine ligase
MKQYDSIYFVGAGGIGMSALLRYFLAKGFMVGGYDRTESELTKQLIKEGAKIKYTDDINLVEDNFKNPEKALIVYTPAIPDSNTELQWFREKGFKVVKRAALLGLITESERGICVAGTHGKTTTSSMTAHILKQSHVDCNAFLGGILKNYSTNLMLSDKSDLTVIEADEYDRSFHWLHPYMALITAADPDHLDIYGTAEAYYESFNVFTSLIQPGGTLIMKHGLNINPRLQKGVKLFTYSGNSDGDFHAENIRIANGTIIFDFVAPDHMIKDIELGVPVEINIENGVGAIALSYLNGVDDEEIKSGMKSFRGAQRRFDFHLKSDNLVMIDDYAHHPDEIKASIKSVRALYPEKKISVIFQPHLFTRTRDFAKEFAKSLSLADEVILLDIYPARELPIEGVTSEIIFKDLTSKEKVLCKKEELLDLLKDKKFEVLITLGAGDIDKLIEPIKEIITK